MGTIYGYARCSTNEERQDINRQKRDLLSMGVEKEEFIYWEYESGTKDDRAELTKLFNIVIPGDSIITTEVSRLTRSTKMLCDILKVVQDKKLCLKIGNSFTIDCRNDVIDPMTKGMVMMFGVFSEIERDLISQRVKSGMKNAAAKGSKIGRPETSVENIPSSFFKAYARYQSNQLTITEMAKILGCTRATVYKYIRIVSESSPS